MATLLEAIPLGALIFHSVHGTMRHEQTFYTASLEVMGSSHIPAPHADLPLLSKRDLIALSDGLLTKDQWFIDRCVEFVASETKGLWHGRARASMCRRLKHCGLGRTQKTILVRSITQRLISGDFSEQFKDQLRLAMHLDLKQTLEAAQKSISSTKGYVSRYAKWVLSHENL